ncbi:hypothetical protein N7454_009577 [Penicillium verhagenii]|nr:hypothetical protein N7454_009577 [Penicillium verhagenii]
MGNFTIVNANLQVAIDVSGNGALSWPPSESADAPTLSHNITLFLTSQSKSHNFTISNGTIPATNTTGYVGPVLDLEPSSTVKHVNWIWPTCFVDGTSSSSDGTYNISMHQSFRWNDTDYYTVFDWPISVTNSIPESSDRVDCALLQNKMLNQDAESSDSLPGQPWLTSEVATSSTQSGTAANATQSSVGSSVRRKVKVALAATVLVMFSLMG